LEKIPSTQTYAHDLIARGRGADCTAVMATAQSAGRGRRARTWVSHHGNLYISFIYQTRRARDARMSYAVAVAVAETVAAFGAPARIKWPNDILVDGKKISGILIEYNGDYVVVGVGINIKTNPTVSAEYATTRLDRYSNDVTRRDVLRVLMEKLDMWRAADWPAVRARWMALSAHVGDTVRYMGVAAKFVEIDDSGAMVLQRNGEIVRVYGDEIAIVEN